MATQAIPTQNIGGMTYYDDGKGNLVDYLGRPAPGSDANRDPSGGSQYTQGVTAQSLIDPTVTNSYNPQQLATPDAAAALAQQTGLRQSSYGLAGPGVPDAQIQNVGASNAGLAQGIIDRYGPPTPGSYSEYMIQRDQPGNTGNPAFGDYGSYFHSAPVQTAIKQAQTTQPGVKQSVALPPSGGLTGNAPAAGGTYTGSISKPQTTTPRSAATNGGFAGAPWGSAVPSPSTATQPYTGSITPRGGASGTLSPSWHNPNLGVPAPLPTPPPASTPPTGGSPAPTGGGAAPPYQRIPVQGPPIPGATGPAQAPNAGYAPRPQPAKFTSGGYANYDPYPAGVDPIYSQQQTPEGLNKGEGLQFKTENDRALALQRGEQINSDLNNYTNDQYAQAGDFSDLQGAAYSGIAAGQGGYSGDEKNAILRQDELSSLQQTPEEAQQNYLTQQEQAGILGDTGAAYRQLGTDEAGIDTSSVNRDQYARGEFNTGRDLTNQALTAQDQGVRTAVAGQKDYTRATVAGEAANARQYLDPTALNTSAEYNQNYNFGARDAQDIVDKAGRTVGAGAQADEDRILSEANAAGNTSPLALEAARNRVRQGGRVGAADAMTDARFQAKDLALQTAQQKENTRLGAAQNYANLGTGTELNLGQDALSNEQSLGAAQIGAESYLGDQHVKAQQALGQQGTQLEKDLGQSHIDIGTKGAEMNLAAGQAADTANSARAGQIATNRQATSVGNQNTQYNRGLTQYNTESAANKDFATQRLAQEAEYRKTLADRQAQAAQNTTIGNQQRIGNYGTQTSAINAAEGNAITNYKVPSSGEKILNGIASLVPGAKGLVAPGPQRALIGEAGPELEVDIAKLPHYGGGYDPLDEYGTAPGYVTGSGETETEGNGLPGGTVTRNGNNPLWKTIINNITPGGIHPFGPPQTDDEPNYNPLSKPKQKGGVLGRLLSGGSLTGYAEGGIVDGAEREQVAPGISYVNGPQIRTLGQHGPTAIVPLQYRKSNKINVSDIPELARRYGHYGT